MLFSRSTSCSCFEVVCWSQECYSQRNHEKRWLSFSADSWYKWTKLEQEEIPVECRKYSSGVRKNTRFKSWNLGFSKPLHKHFDYYKLLCFWVNSYTKKIGQIFATKTLHKSGFSSNLACTNLENTKSDPHFSNLNDDLETVIELTSVYWVIHMQWLIASNQTKV